ncbi:Alkali-sensitive linkage 1-like protein [Cladobotryum mycophilum]|uniref:Alkali-sensitive linkage 1-like protein n=1 Tax=Cladobotryum mycophilum TaxID=491253 RepID=A0ABR0SI83_9HYPO
MRFLLTALLPLVAATSSAKRGLIFIPNSNWPQDNSIWVKPGSDLTWYYTYNNQPAPDFAHIPQSQFEFVPMMWGVGPNPDQDTAFLNSVRQLISNGTNVTHVMSYNEPDAPAEWGGSNVSPANAARAWKANFAPLKKQGIKVGLPAVTGAPSGLLWLKQFVGNCTLLLGSPCSYDFLPVHWYDNFGGLQSHVNEAIATFPGTKIWVTEFAYANQNLAATQSFYNQSIAWLDSLGVLERYSYFGAFRSKVSNVGPNATFLNNAGKLTDIGSWYLGGGSTGVDPQSG